MRVLSFLTLLVGFCFTNAALPKLFKPLAVLASTVKGKHAGSSNLTPQEKDAIIRNASFGYPNATSGFQRAPPKSSLYHVNIPNLKDQSRTAAPWILDLVEFVHYAPFVPGFLGAWSVFKNTDKWANAFAGLPHVQLRILFLILSPVVAVLGGLPGFTMHDYEGWQVTPFKNPLLEKVDNYVNNNAWLREVAYKYIFVIQYFALVLFNLAVLGISPLHVGLSILGLFLQFAGNPSKKLTFIIWDQPSFPLSVCVFIPFVIAATVNLYANYKVFNGLHLGLIPLLAPLLNAFGGAFEGIVAETRFNQWYHIIAVLGFNISMWLEWYFFEQSTK